VARHSQLAECLARLFCDLRPPDPLVSLDSPRELRQQGVFGSLPKMPPAEPPQPRTASDLIEAQARLRRRRFWKRDGENGSQKPETL
jgi:hypothetical protein